MPSNTRLTREFQTLQHMVGLYCRGLAHPQEPGQALCPDCEQLLAYAQRRLFTCRFGENKPVCADCRVHCYRSDEAGRIRRVMRYAGPRMLLSHPALSIFHLIDSIRFKPRKTRQE
ncbi:MAG: nitrous oxide-stimulated promoter family protein [Anaerolineae bacterium]|nr:nitrous oxide-stimulated promoter family protein [Anaerolineae bacterium]